MTSGKYFNKGVKALDAADVGHLVRGTTDKIIVFGKKGQRYDIPIREIQQVGANVLIGLHMSDIIDRFLTDREEPLPPDRVEPAVSDTAGDINLATYEGRYPSSLFNKGVRANNEDDLGHIMRETIDKIIVFGYSSTRCDIPKSHIIAVGRNVIVDLDFPEIYNYQVSRNAPLPNDKSKELEEDKDVDRMKEKEGYITTTEKSDEELDKYNHGQSERLIHRPQKKGHSGQLFDLQTLLTQRQDRLSQALQQRYRYNT